MNIFLARQPILNRFNKLFGYELLFRDSEKTYTKVKMEIRQLLKL